MDSQFAFRRASGQKGFSLIECVISMAVLTIGALGLLGVFGVAVKATAASQGDLIARQLASEWLCMRITSLSVAEYVRYFVVTDPESFQRLYLHRRIHHSEVRRARWNSRYGRRCGLLDVIGCDLPERWSEVPE